MTGFGPSGASGSLERTSRLAEWGLRAVVVVAVGFVFLPVLRHPTQVVYSDAYDLLSGHEPYRHLMTESLRRYGRLPLYDPTAFGGMPLVGDPQSGILYPPNWLHALGGGPLWFGWSMLLHLCVGGWGVLWWLRAHFPGAAPRLAGALAFALAGKWFAHVVSAGHIVFLPLVWVPWQLGLVDRIVRTGSPRACGWLAAATALVLTGMHPQLLLYSQLLVALYAAISLGCRHGTAPVRSGLLLGSAGAIGVALAASQLLPSLASAEFFVRGELPYVVAAWKSLTPHHLLGMLLPEQGRGGGSTEDVAFLGVAVLACASFAPWVREQRGTVLFFVVCLVVCTLYALGPFGGPHGGLHRLLFEFAPGFDLFRRPSRMLLVAGLPLAFLTGAGVQALCARPTNPRKRVLAGLLLAAGASLVATFRSSESVWALLGLALPALCLLPQSQSLPRHIGWLAAFVVFFDLARFDAPQVRTKPLEEILGENRVADWLRAPLGEGRVVALHRGKGPWDSSSLPAAYATGAGLESLGGYNPLIPRATYEYLQAGVAQHEPNFRMAATTIPSMEIASRPHLDLFNTRWVVTHVPIDVDGLVLRTIFPDQRVYLSHKAGLSRPRNAHVYENVRRLPRAALVRRARAVADSDAAIGEISRLDPRREVLVEDPDLVGSYPGHYQPLSVDHRGDELEFELDAGAGGYLVLSEIWYPGWHADDAGEPVEIHRANGIFQVVRLGPGPHRLQFRYRPRAWVVGSRISVAALAVTGGLLLLGGPRRTPA